MTLRLKTIFLFVYLSFLCVYMFLGRHGSTCVCDSRQCRYSWAGLCWILDASDLPSWLVSPAGDKSWRSVAGEPYCGDSWDCFHDLPFRYTAEPTCLICPFIPVTIQHHLYSCIMYLCVSRHAQNIEKHKWSLRWREAWCSSSFQTIACRQSIPLTSPLLLSMKTALPLQ